MGQILSRNVGRECPNMSLSILLFREKPPLPRFRTCIPNEGRAAQAFAMLQAQDPCIQNLTLRRLWNLGININPKMMKNWSPCWSLLLKDTKVPFFHAFLSGWWPTLKWKTSRLTTSSWSPRHVIDENIDPTSHGSTEADLLLCFSSVWPSPSLIHPDSQVVPFYLFNRQQNTIADDCSTLIPSHHLYQQRNKEVTDRSCCHCLRFGQVLVCSSNVACMVTILPRRRNAALAMAFFFST